MASNEERIEKIKRTLAKRTARNKAAFLEAFEKKAGNIGAACKAAGIDRQTYLNYKSSDEEFKNALWEIFESLKDHQESVVFMAGKTDWKAALEWNKVYNKDRGWGGQVDIKMEGKIHVTLPDDFE